MPASCYSKAVREPVHFLWERRRGKGKAGCAQFRSIAATGVRFGKAARSRSCDPVQVSFAGASRFAGCDAGLRSRGPREALRRSPDNERRERPAESIAPRKRDADGWDPADALARYAVAGIEIAENR